MEATKIPSKSEVLELLMQVAKGNSEKSPRKRVSESIASLIEDRRLPAQTPLPPSSELGDIFGVSLVTLQAAMSELAEERGLISRKPRIGSFVASLPYSSDDEHLELNKVCVFSNLVADYSQDPISNTFINSILQSGHRRGYEIVLEHEKQFKDLCVEENIVRWKRMLAVIIISPSREALMEAERLAGLGCRVLLLNAHSDVFGIGSAYSDNLTGCYYAAKKLISLGHRNICFLVPRSLDAHSSYRDRLAGCQRALNEAGLTGPIVLDKYEISEFETMLDRNAPDRVTAILDIGGYPVVMQVLELLKLKVPEDVSLVSYDQEKTITSDGKTVATIVQPVSELVERAFSMIPNLRSGGFILKLPQMFLSGRTIAPVKCRNN